MPIERRSQSFKDLLQLLQTNALVEATTAEELVEPILLVSEDAITNNKRLREVNERYRVDFKKAADLILKNDLTSKVYKRGTAKERLSLANLTCFFLEQGAHSWQSDKDEAIRNFKASRILINFISQKFDI